IYGNMFGSAGPVSETLIINTQNNIIKKIPSLDEEKQELLCKHIYDLALISQRKLTAEELDNFISTSVQVLGFIG
ncbi:MAG: molecular chaperone HtpG, partial [Clostridia bacterium]|nr:molecular chaperone HtpG [Clostridia bacterium]